MRSILFSCFLFLLLSTNVFAAGDFMYTAALLPGTNCSALALNSSGQVVGQYTNILGDTRAFLWSSADGMEDLGVLVGYDTSRANDINDSGQVVGECGKSGSTETQAFYDDEYIEPRYLGTLGGTYTSAHAINNAGTIVGVSNLSGDASAHAFVYNTDDGMVDIVQNTFGTDGSSSEGINDDGTVMLHRYDDSYVYSTYLWNTVDGFTALTGFSAESGIGRNLNGTPMVIGWTGSVIGGGAEAFSWTSSGGVVLLPTNAPVERSYANAVNASGVIVGAGRSTEVDAVDIPLLWTDGTVYDLNDVTELDSGWVLYEARDINNRGQIICTGAVNGTFSSFLLTPVTRSALPFNLLLLSER